MKPIKKGGSLFIFFKQSPERSIPIIWITILLLFTIGFWVVDGLDNGVIFSGSIYVVALLALFIEGYLSWKKLNK